MTKHDKKPCIRCKTADWYDCGSCKECAKRNHKRRYDSSPDIIKKRKAKETAVWKCLVCGCVKKNTDGKCHDCANRRSREFRAKNKERFIEYERQYRKENSDQVREKLKRFADENREKMRQWNMDWSKNNRDTVNANRNKRKTRLSNAGGSYTANEWKTLCENHDNKCLCCGEKTKLTADHIVPVFLGGTSDISNIQPLCQSCNSSKGVQIIDYR